MTTVVVFTVDSLAELARLDEAADSEMRSPEAAVAPHSNRVGATSVEEAQQLRDAITRRIIQDTIADMNLDPATEAVVVKAFTGVGLFCPPLPIIPSQARQSLDPICCGDGVESGISY